MMITPIVPVSPSTAPNKKWSTKLSERIPGSASSALPVFDVELVDNIFKVCNFNVDEIIRTLTMAYSYSNRASALSVISNYIDAYSNSINLATSRKEMIDTSDISMYNMLVGIYSAFNKYYEN